MNIDQLFDSRGDRELIRQVGRLFCRRATEQRSSADRLLSERESAGSDEASSDITLSP